MITIKGKEFEMVQSNETGPFFDLSLLVKVNEGKDTERTEMKLVAHGLPFESCMQKIVGIKMADKNGVYTVAEFIAKYKVVVDEVAKLITNEKKPKKVKEESTDESE